MLPVKCPFYKDFIDQWMGTNKFMLVLCPREHATTIKAKWFNKSFVKNLENYFIHMLISPHHLQQVEDRDRNWEIIFGPCTPLGKIKKLKIQCSQNKSDKEPLRSQYAPCLLCCCTKLLGYSRFTNLFCSSDSCSDVVTQHKKCG